MGKGSGLFFAFEGSADGPRQHLVTERLLRDLVPVLQQRIDVRDRMRLAMLDLLDTMTVVADEYRMIAVVRGEEITRLQRDRIIRSVHAGDPRLRPGRGDRLRPGEVGKNFS